jgi:protease-4
MAEENNDFWQELGRELRQAGRSLSDGLNNSGVALRNWLRQARGAKVDYVALRVGGPLPERAGPPRNFIQRQLPLPPEPLTMEELNYHFQVVADATNVKGVILIFQGFAAGLATLQNLRRAIERLRQAGKEVIVYTPYLDLPHYYAATAANRIIAPHSSHFDVLGLRSESMFLKDALARVGIQADMVQISPYKTAGNIFSKADMTPEQRAQMEWLLDDEYAMITAAIATGRQLPLERVLELIDQSPMTAEQAQANCLLDGLAYEDELAYLLAGDESGEDKEEEREEAKEEENGQAERPKAELLTWDKAFDLMTEKWRRTVPKRIGVVSLEGAITMGPSRQPPIDLPIPLIGGASAGEQTIIQQLRQAEHDDSIAALIFHVDSPGGSALASDLIWRQIQRIRQQKPVVVLMGNVAASGGYYVSAAGQHIMAQSGTITGSIGVLSGRISTAGLYEKISVNRVSIQRGRRAGLYSEDSPLTEEERQLFWQGIIDTYQQFKQVVATGRNLVYEELDPICEGRVWTGRQALEHKLVDSHGDFIDAVQRAAELAGLPTDDDHEITVSNLYPKERGYLLPKPFEAGEEIGRLLSGDWLQGMFERPMLLMPFTIKLW